MAHRSTNYLVYSIYYMVYREKDTAYIIWDHEKTRGTPVECPYENGYIEKHLPVLIEISLVQKPSKCKSQIFS